MKRQKECIAMLLAGGQGSRLGNLTKRIAKPAVPFGGIYRIIDFSLSNCRYSGIDTIGVLTQYKPFLLNSYVGVGTPWDLDVREGGVYVLPPYVDENGGQWYKGTANAIYQNMDFIEHFNPKYVLVISGDHIYKMDYSLMLESHKANKADATISVIEVPWEEASRFGIMSTDENNSIIEFAEKPKNPKSNLASMGIYIFDWPVLKKYLEKDEKDPNSENDFGKNVIPRMLKEGKKMQAYKFKGYWKDVGTIESYYKANMDLLNENPDLDIFDNGIKIYSQPPVLPPHYIAKDAVVKNSLIPDGCMIMGQVEHSVLFPGVYVGKGTVVKDSILLPNVRIGNHCVITNSILGEQSVIGNYVKIGFKSQITVIGDSVVFPDWTEMNKATFLKNSSKEKIKIS